MNNEQFKQFFGFVQGFNAEVVQQFSNVVRALNGINVKNQLHTYIPNINDTVHQTFEVDAATPQGLGNIDNNTDMVLVQFEGAVRFTTSKVVPDATTLGFVGLTGDKIYLSVQEAHAFLVVSQAGNVRVQFCQYRTA